MKNNIIKIVVASLLFAATGCQAGALARVKTYSTQALSYGMQAARLAKTHPKKAFALTAGTIVFANYIGANRSKTRLEETSKRLNGAIARVKKCLKDNAAQIQEVQAAQGNDALKLQDVKYALGQEIAWFTLTAKSFKQASDARYDHYWLRMVGAAPVVAVDPRLALIKTIVIDDDAEKQMDLFHQSTRTLTRTMRAVEASQQPNLSEEEKKKILDANNALIKEEGRQESIAWIDQVKKAFDAYIAS